MTGTGRIPSLRAGAGLGGRPGTWAQHHDAPLCLSLSTENIFGSSQSSHRLRRRKPLPSKQVSATTSFPALEEADAEEKEAFLAFIEQLGTGHLLPK